MHLLQTNEGICRQCFTKLENFHSFSKMMMANIDLTEKSSTGKRLLMSPESTSLVQPSLDMTKKMLFSPKKCDFMNDQMYSSKAVQHKGMSVLCCHCKTYFKSLLHNYFNIIIISL